VQVPNAADIHHSCSSSSGKRLAELQHITASAVACSRTVLLSSVLCYLAFKLVLH
jgi:hypothetical protein